ncbi:MAG: cation diffusion facilitator family transporter, partial [Bacteroidales bacterium]|nr:cation diffusion facilitator family transporter [Bacteroidales bacterium]
KHNFTGLYFYIMPAQKNQKTQVARLSVFSNSFLIALKVGAGILSGSVSIISEAIHSSMDLLASCIAYFAVKVSDTPSDEKHNYGHGKIENVSGVIEGMLIFIAAGWIIIEAVKKLTNPEPVESLGIGSIVMLISAGVNILVSRKLYKTAKLTHSVALEADALHLKTDVLTSFGVAAGLILIMITKILWFDPIIAMIVALMIIRESFDLLKRAFWPLLDVAWDKEELEKLNKIFKEMDVKQHDVKTRKAGNYRFIDFHIVMPPEIPFEQVHDFCSLIESEIQRTFENVQVTIHPEPFDH